MIGLKKHALLQEARIRLVMGPDSRGHPYVVSDITGGY